MGGVIEAGGGGVKVKISDIPEEGLSVSERFDPKEHHLETEDLSFQAPLQVQALFHKGRQAVIAHVMAQGRMALTCGRCLKLFEEPYTGEFDLDYAVGDQLFLDITDDVRQEILLSYPVKLLCRPGCLGLCIHCGANLNEGDCGCSPKRES